MDDKIADLAFERDMAVDELTSEISEKNKRISDLETRVQILEVTREMSITVIPLLIGAIRSFFPLIPVYPSEISKSIDEIEQKYWAVEHLADKKLKK